jgi:hypothetical protein
MSKPAPASVIADFDAEAYRIHEIAEVMTPALAIYPEIVDANIQTTLRLVGGDAGRLRPHVKTAKLASVMRQWAAHGVTNFKCSTSLELLTVCEAGATDALLAYPLIGAGARRIRELADQFAAARAASACSLTSIPAWIAQASGRRRPTRSSVWPIPSKRAASRFVVCITMTATSRNMRWPSAKPSRIAATTA